MGDDRQWILESQNDVSENQRTDEESRQWNGCFYVPKRYILAFMMFLAYFISFAQRTCFNLALVAMVNMTSGNHHGNMTESEPTQAPVHNHTNNHDKNLGQFNWDADLQGLLLGAFYYGYPISQLPGGYLADRYGGKYVMAFVGIGTGLLSVLIPVTADFSPYALFALRVLQGVCQGALYPAVIVMIGRWIAVKDRNTAMALVMTGMVVGIATAQGVSGYLCESTFLQGWPSVFYIFGGISILWTLFWLPLVYNTPNDHPRISAAEKTYIEKGTEGISKVKPTRTPWCSILTSIPLWGIIIVRFLDAFSYYVVFNCISIYLKQVLMEDIEEDGILSALPYVTQIFMGPLVGFVADFIWKRELLRVVNIRRAVTVLGELLPGCLLAMVGYASSAKLAVALLILYKAFGSFLAAGPNMSLFDIAPMYAGTLMGLMNGIANMPGFIAPQVVAAITDNSSDMRKWRMVFLIGGGTSAFGTFLYCLLITDKEQEWAKPQPEEQHQSTGIPYPSKSAH